MSIQSSANDIFSHDGPEDSATRLNELLGSNFGLSDISERNLFFVAYGKDAIRGAVNLYSSISNADRTSAMVQPKNRVDPISYPANFHKMGLVALVDMFSYHTQDFIQEEMHRGSSIRNMAKDHYSKTTNVMSTDYTGHAQGYFRERYILGKQVELPSLFRGNGPATFPLGEVLKSSSK